MKKLYLAVILLCSLTSNATIRTVSNSPATLAQYNTIQAAIDASSSGDTVYVHGSPNDYALFTITDTRLVIIGPGRAPNKNMPFTARVGGMTISGALSSNSEIQGLIFTTTVSIYTGTHPDGLKFIRNEFIGNYIYIHGAGTYKGFLFEGNYFNGCIINASSSSFYENFLFQNNAFYHLNNYQVTAFTNSTNVIFNHNLWYGPASGASDCFNANCRFLLITNNIFVRRNAAVDNSFSTFNNNITFNAVANTPWAVNNNVNGGGNVDNQSPAMVDQTGINAGTNNSLFDFTIAAGPANNSGSDGKDMGLLFDATGSLNWLTSRSSRLSFIFSMNITNPTIASGGTLNVIVEARKNN